MCIAAGFAFDSTTTVCSVCSVGRYQDQSGAASVSCLTCGAGQFAASNEIACADCQTGAGALMSVILADLAVPDEVYDAQASATPVIGLGDMAV